MAEHYVSSSLVAAATPSRGAPAGLLATLRRWLEGLRGWQALLVAELHEQRLARDIDRAYAGLDARTRRDLGIDRRLS